MNLLCAASVVAMSLVRPAHADDKDVIAYRQLLMKTLNEQSAAIGQILSGAVADDNLVNHLEAVALAASLVPRSFDAKVPGGESKADLWENWADFSKRTGEFALKTAQAAKTAKAQGKDAVMHEIVDALSCKSCHDKYRQEK